MDMVQYKYPFGSIWLSHTSISDFEKCPRSYYLRNVYKEIPIGKKIQVVNPYLTLGIVVHDTLESIRYLPKDVRFSKPLVEIFENIWNKNSGKKGGFISQDQEDDFKKRGLSMIENIQENPGPIANLSTVIKKKDEVVSNMWLSEKDGLILCGNVDWIEVLPDGSLHIIDFKTGKHEEDEESLQLQIYMLLAKTGNKRPVSKVSYWYLDKQSSPTEVKVPSLNGVVDKLIQKGIKIKEFRSTPGSGKTIACPKGGCRYCEEYESVLQGKAEKVGYDEGREKVLYFVSK